MAESKKAKTMFETLYDINVNDKTESREGLTYLSWSWAWAEFKKVYPNAVYEVKKFENGLPYAYDENTGYMVYTSVTVDDLTHEMWLPVMDSHNRAMKKEPYTVKTKYSEFTVNSATMFDINKAIMRCLTKNLAMFGLGLYIYAGEDLPEAERDEEQVVETKAPGKAETLEEKQAKLKGMLEARNSDVTVFLEWCSKTLNRDVKSVDELKYVELINIIEAMEKKQKGGK